MDKGPEVMELNGKHVALQGDVLAHHLPLSSNSLSLFLSFLRTPFSFVPSFDLGFSLLSSFLLAFILPQLFSPRVSSYLSLIDVRLLESVAQVEAKHPRKPVPPLQQLRIEALRPGQVLRSSHLLHRTVQAPQDRPDDAGEGNHGNEVIAREGPLTGAVENLTHFPVDVRIAQSGRQGTVAIVIVDGGRSSELQSEKTIQDVDREPDAPALLDLLALSRTYREALALDVKADALGCAGGLAERRPTPVIVTGQR